MTVAAGRVSSVPMLRWLMVVGALFTVAFFAGSSCADGPLPLTPVSGHGACPNVILQASLPGVLAAEAGGGGPEGGHGPGEVAAGACLFVVVALAGLALAGAVRRPLLVYVASWRAWLGMPRTRPPSAGPMWLGVLRI